MKWCVRTRSGVGSNALRCLGLKVGFRRVRWGAVWRHWACSGLKWCHVWYCVVWDCGVWCHVYVVALPPPLLLPCPLCHSALAV